jgi:hypothetical protein
MAKEKLNVEITATDQASAQIENVAKKLDAVAKSKATARIDADIKGATAALEDIDKRLAGLSNADKKIVLDVVATNARATINRITQDLAQAHKLSDEEIQLRIEARDQASRVLDDVQSKLRDIDGTTADVAIDADTSGLDSGLAGIADKLSGLDGQAGAFGAQLGKLATPSGAIAGIAGGLLLAADNAANLAIEADNLAGLTGDSVEEASRLNAVWKSTGADAKDLQDVLLQMNGVLATDADLAKELGVNLNDGATIGQRFKQVADALDEIPDAAKRSQIASRVFGEEGVRQYNAMKNAVGDLGTAMENLPEGSVVSEEDVENAREFRRQITELKTELAALASTLGSAVIPAVLGLADGINKAADKAEDMHLDDVARWATFVEPAKKLGGAIEDVGNWLGIGGDKADDYNKALAESGKQANDYRAALTGMAEANQEAIRVTEAHRFAMRDSGHQAEDYERALTAQGEAYQALKQEQDAVISAARAERDSWAQTYDALVANKRATDDLRDAKRNLADQTYALHDAELTLEQTIERSTQTLDDETTSLREARGAMQEVASAADAVAQEQVAMNGQTLNSTEGMATWITSMLNSAATLSGPLRAEVLNHISAISGIPVSKLTEIGVEIDAARLAEIEADLNWTARERFVRISPQGGQNFYASGTTSAKPGIALVGEDGPELVNLAGGERIFSASETKAIASDLGNMTTAAASGPSAVAGTTVNLNVNVDARGSTNPVEVGRKTAEALAAWVRAGGDVRIFQQAFAAA